MPSSYETTHRQNQLLSTMCNESRDLRDGIIVLAPKAVATSLNRLSAKSVSAIIEPGRHADGGNLYLLVSKTGAKSWVFMCRYKGCPVRTGPRQTARSSAGNRSPRPSKGKPTISLR
jgi:hypothetical protein